MTQVPDSPQQTAQEQSLLLACGPQEQLHMEVTVRWVRQPAAGEEHKSQGGDPGPPQEKQPGGNSLRASHLPSLDAPAGDEVVQRQSMSVVCGPNEAVQLRQWIDVTSRAESGADGTVRSQGTDPGNQGSKQGGGNSLRA